MSLQLYNVALMYSINKLLSATNYEFMTQVQAVLPIYLFTSMHFNSCVRVCVFVFVHAQVHKYQSLSFFIFSSVVKVITFSFFVLLTIVLCRQSVFLAKACIFPP